MKISKKVFFQIITQLKESHTAITLLRKEVSELTAKNLLYKKIIDGIKEENDAHS